MKYFQVNICEGLEQKNDILTYIKLTEFNDRYKPEGHWRSAVMLNIKSMIEHEFHLQSWCRRHLIALCAALSN